MATIFERCPKCGADNERNLFKVKIVDGKVWLFCSGTKACRWRIELTGLAAEIQNERSNFKMSHYPNAPHIAETAAIPI